MITPITQGSKTHTYGNYLGHNILQWLTYRIFVLQTNGSQDVREFYLDSKWKYFYDNMQKMKNTLRYIKIDIIYMLSIQKLILWDKLYVRTQKTISFINMGDNFLT